MQPTKDSVNNEGNFGSSRKRNRSISFVSIFLGDERIKKIDLSNRDFDKQTLKSLGESLYLARELKELNLEGVNLVYAEENNMLLDAIKAHPTLQEVKVSGYTTFSGATFDQKTTHQNFIEKLNEVLSKKIQFKSNESKSVDLSASESLKLKSDEKIVNTAKDGIGTFSGNQANFQQTSSEHIDLVSFFYKIDIENIQSIDLTRLRVDANSCYIIFNKIEACVKLNRLKIGIDDSYAMKSLMFTLKKCKNIEHLEIAAENQSWKVSPTEFNSTNLKSLKILSGVLPTVVIKSLIQNTTITDLDVSENPNLGYSNVIKALKIISENNCIKTLNLKECGMGKSATQSLVEALFKNKNLENLNLEGNNFFNPSLNQQLLKVIKDHLLLTNIKIDLEPNANIVKVEPKARRMHIKFVEDLRKVLDEKIKNNHSKASESFLKPLLSYDKPHQEKQILKQNNENGVLSSPQSFSSTHSSFSQSISNADHLKSNPLSLLAFTAKLVEGEYSSCSSDFSEVTKTVGNNNLSEKSRIKRAREEEETLSLADSEVFDGIDLTRLIEKWDVQKFHKGDTYLSQEFPKFISMQGWKFIEQYTAIYNEALVDLIIDSLNKNKNNNSFINDILVSLPLCFFCNDKAAQGALINDTNRLFAAHSFLPEDIRIKFIQLKLKHFVEQQYQEDLISNPETAAGKLIVKVQLLHPFTDKNSRVNKIIYKQLTKGKEENFEQIRALGLEELFGIDPDRCFEELKIVPRSADLFINLDSYITAKRALLENSVLHLRNKRLCTLNKAVSSNSFENNELKSKVALFNECKARIEKFGESVVKFYCGDDTLPLLRTQYTYNAENDSVSKYYKSNFAFCYMLGKNPLTDYKDYINKSKKLACVGKDNTTFVCHFNSIAFNGSVDEYLCFLKNVVKRLEKVGYLFELDKSRNVKKGDELQPLMTFIREMNIENLNQLFEQYILNHDSYKNSYTIDKAYEEQSGSYKSLETIGNGVYATGEDKSILLPYTGVISFAEKAFDHDSWYVWSGRSKESIDGMIQTGFKNYLQLGSLINDTLVDAKTVVASPYNVQIVKLPGLILYLSKSLQKDIQLFVDYGSEYWKGRQRLKLNEKRISLNFKKKEELDIPAKTNPKKNQQAKPVFSKKRF